MADTPNATDVLTVTGYTTDDAGVLWYFGTDYRTKAEFYVIANQMTAVDEETARALMAQIDANQPTEPEQPETVKVDEQLSALMSKIYGARPFGGMGVAEEALYNGMGEDGMSRGLFWYLGTDDIKFEAGVASESMITSQAHSIVVLRFADEKQAADAAAKLKTTVDPRKWICVGVDEAKVVSKGKLVCVVMDDENGDYYINNFKANA